jgi:Uma2 family endonuclease
MNIRLVPEIEYPESDGKPMAETPYHMRVMIDLIETLRAWFKPNRRVYVWGNMFVYYVPGDPRKNVSPDLMVVKGVDRDRPRRVFKVWEEGRGPSATIEITSRKTRAEDTDTKFQLYQEVLKVREYFLFDPLDEYLKPALKGYRLRRGVYVPIEPEAERLPSKELGLHLEKHGQALRLWNAATAQWLPTWEEAFQQEQQARQGMEAENERLRRELAELRKQRKPE